MGTSCEPHWKIQVTANCCQTIIMWVRPYPSCHSNSYEFNSAPKYPKNSRRCISRNANGQGSPWMQPLR